MRRGKKLGDPPEMNIRPTKWTGEIFLLLRSECEDVGGLPQDGCEAGVRSPEFHNLLFCFDY